MGLSFSKALWRFWTKDGINSQIEEGWNHWQSTLMQNQCCPGRACLVGQRNNIRPALTLGWCQYLQPNFSLNQWNCQSLLSFAWGDYHCFSPHSLFLQHDASLCVRSRGKKIWKIKLESCSNLLTNLHYPQCDQQRWLMLRVMSNAL